MGNSATKEQRDLPPPLQPPDSGQSSSHHTTGPDSSTHDPRSEQSYPQLGHDVRTNRPDFLSTLGVTNPDRQASGLEVRKETKQEREARKLEKERIARAKERERSMREEHVDGGYVVTQGVYTGTEDYNKGIVRQLMVWNHTSGRGNILSNITADRTSNSPILERAHRPFKIMDRKPAGGRCPWLADTCC